MMMRPCVVRQSCIGRNNGKVGVGRGVLVAQTVAEYYPAPVGPLSKGWTTKMAGADEWESRTSKGLMGDCSTKRDDGLGPMTESVTLLRLHPSGTGVNHGKE